MAKTGKFNQYNALSRIMGEVDTITFYDSSAFSEVFRNVGNSFEESFTKYIKGRKDNLLKSKQLYHKFRINPDNLTVGNKKVDSIVYTKKGHERQYHGEDLVTFTYRGSTGYMQSYLRSIGINDIRFSEAWAKFEGFKKFYTDSEDDVNMYYDGAVYEGFFGNFNYRKDANDPFQIKYDFIFTAYPNQVHNISTAFSLPEVQVGFDIANVSSRIVTII